MSGAGQGATPSRDQLAKGAAEEAANDGSQVTSGSHEVLLSPETFTHHPYSAYMRTYEKYEGNLKNYVRACVYLEYLQRRRWLSSFLYDDFIRAFTNYIRYVENLDEDNQPLSAVEWYNETVDKPQYTKGIVTRHNLEGILKTYPEQVSTAYDSQEKRTLLAEAQLTGREAISPALEESQPLQESGGEDTTQAPEKADGNVEKVSGSPRLHSSTSIHVGSDSFEEKNASDEVTEVAATQDVGTIVTQPPIVSPRLTQPSVDRTQRIPQTVLKTKMAPPPLPRKSVISSPADAARPPSLPANSPLASVVSRTSSTKSRRKIEGPERKSKTKSRRKDEDPDARSRRFQKFLERRRRGSATPASSIVSSSYGKGSE
ncbi:hypothetical protein NKR23_g2738 [Pleurostoma richardsiae]|uniref:Uncharacterized protein n=1 Tax=Pleurostoma richardsiae TaxID=41990 RepID=A0AA38S0S2_9PEZI|nr:hypothetical protein NKR23_g2738 [Pleurostoma richardsiae]